MPQTVRIGIIGAGNFSRNRLLPNFRALPDVELVAVANRSLASAQRVADEFNIPNPMDDWHALLKRPDVDVVLVGTQPYFHHEAVMAALDAGKHVLCQTRMATSFHDAREMRDKVQQTGLKAMLVRSGTYLKGDKYVKHLLDSGYLGQVRQVFAYYFVPNYIDSAAPLHRRQDHRPYGTINPMALGIYWDVLRPWFGDPERVLAWGKTFTRQRADGPSGPPITVEMPDALTVVAEMPDGAMVTCIQSGVAMFGQERIEIFGEEGTLVYPAQGELLGARKGDQALAPLPIPDEYQDTWHVERDFVALVRGDVESAGLSFHDGVRNIEFLEAAHFSAAEGRWVDLPLP